MKENSSSTLIKDLIKILGPDKILQGEKLSNRYEHIWTMNKSLDALAVALPETTQEVSSILSVCNQHNQPVTMHGGLTGLVGSTVTGKHELVLSFEKMDRILEVDASSRTITVEAGVILESIHEELKNHGLLFPLNFGAKGSAQVGGFISTNAGGLRVFRYGMTRELVLGLEVVLADGTILTSMKKIIKDNSGYDLKQLFIGSEGTLGVVTKAVFKVVEAPRSRNSAWLAVNTFQQVIDLLKFLDAGLAGTLSGFELIWGETFEALTSPPATVKSPLDYGFPFYVLIESLGGDQVKDQQQFENLLSEAMERQLIDDAAIAYTAADLEWFWQIREDVRVLIAQCTYNQQYDVSISIPEIGHYVKETREKLMAIPEVDKVFALGHLADGNIHFSLSKTREDDALKHQVNQVIYASLKDLGGSVSAEHGIGLDKKRYLPISRTDEEIQIMRLLKKSLDPNGILNRGRILDV
jgi:FAD/FMN-containing dehydrogenase